MKTILGVVAAMALLIGCRGDDGPPVPPATVKYECADVVNVDQRGACEAMQTSWLISSAHALEVDAGEVSRGELINVQQILDNPSPVAFDGWIRAEFDAGCNGAPTWEILPLQRITIAAGDLLDVSVGGFCGDMPLGERVLVGEAYALDAVTLIDSVTVRFTLIE